MHTEMSGSDTEIACYPTVDALKSKPDLRAGELVETAGFHEPGDGGGGLYRVEKADGKLQPNGADAIDLGNGLTAGLLEGEAVNYRMFGAVSDGTRNDGIQIKLAHEYADRHQIPVINLSGEFWIKQTNDIPITTPVQWGKTTFHVDERYNDKQKPRFVVRNDRPIETLDLDAKTKAAIVAQVKPGVQIIPELAGYAGYLITVVDENDRIGIRAGASYTKRGWAREELFYVEEEGRIIGDIAWEFQDFTSVTATHCNDNYLVIEGGGFHFSGDTPEDGSPGYHQLGISVHRSRTIIREQWMGLEPGRRDVSLEPRGGLYVLRGVYDVTLENIRAMPWEKNRTDEAIAVKHGTYGIGGGRMLNCTFRNLTAEAGWVAWGVFGTNLNKNFRVENCRLNRIDVHFHCWNLYISNCAIGFKGISVTGGGDLVIENTTRDGNVFVNFRRDYGSRWDGHIRISGCTLRPSGDGMAAMLAYRPDDFDYQYSIGFARSVKIENVLIDYSAAPDADSRCWLIDVPELSKSSEGARLFFPHRIELRNITVEGRAQGVRLIRVRDPFGYELRRTGGYDETGLQPNCTLVCENVQLEKLTPEARGEAHLVIGGVEAGEYADDQALFPRIRFADCDNVCVYLGHCVASATFDRCGVNTVNAPGVRGELTFGDCRLRPDVKKALPTFYAVDSTLGTRFTNCTVHAPVIDGVADPGRTNELGLLEINGSLKHYHLNTALGNEVLGYLESEGIALSQAFVAKLRSHHGLEA